MIEPTKQLTVTFTAQEWNQIMVELGRAKFARVARFILGIQHQCEEQARQDEQPATPVSRLRPVQEPSEDLTA